MAKTEKTKVVAVKDGKSKPKKTLAKPAPAPKKTTAKPAVKDAKPAAKAAKADAPVKENDHAMDDMRYFVADTFGHQGAESFIALSVPR